MKYTLIPTEQLPEVLTSRPDRKSTLSNAMTNEPLATIDIHGVELAIYNNELGEFMNRVPDDLAESTEVWVDIPGGILYWINVNLEDLNIPESLNRLASMVEKVGALDGMMLKVSSTPDRYARTIIRCPEGAPGWIDPKVRKIIEDCELSLDHEWWVMKNQLAGQKG